MNVDDDDDELRDWKPYGTALYALKIDERKKETAIDAIVRVGWNSEQDIADRDFTSAPSQQHLAFEANTA